MANYSVPRSAFSNIGDLLLKFSDLLSSEEDKKKMMADKQVEADYKKSLTDTQNANAQSIMLSNADKKLGLGRTVDANNAWSNFESLLNERNQGTSLPSNQQGPVRPQQNEYQTLKDSGAMRFSDILKDRIDPYATAEANKQSLDQKNFEYNRALQDTRQDTANEQQYKTSERIAAQNFQAGENEKYRDQWEPGGIFNKVERKDVKEFLSRTDRSPVIKSAQSALNVSEEIKSIINSSGDSKYFAQTVAKSKLPRLMGEVGNLAVQEQSVWQGKQDWLSKLNRYATNAANGEMTKADASAVVDLLGTFQDILSKNAINEIDKYKQQTQAISGIDEQRMNTVVDPLLNQFRRYQMKSQTNIGMDLKDNPLGLFK